MKIWPLIIAEAVCPKTVQSSGKNPILEEEIGYGEFELWRLFLTPKATTITLIWWHGRLVSMRFDFVERVLRDLSLLWRVTILD